MRSHWFGPTWAGTLLKEQWQVAYIRSTVRGADSIASNVTPRGLSEGSKGVWFKPPFKPKGVWNKPNFETTLFFFFFLSFFFVKMKGGEG